MGTRVLQHKGAVGGVQGHERSNCGRCGGVLRLLMQPALAAHYDKSALIQIKRKFQKCL